MFRVSGLEFRDLGLALGGMQGLSQKAEQGEGRSF